MYPFAAWGEKRDKLLHLYLDIVGIYWLFNAGV
jgi:hypothetical protein